MLLIIHGYPETIISEHEAGLTTPALVTVLKQIENTFREITLKRFLYGYVRHGEGIQYICVYNNTERKTESLNLLSGSGWRPSSIIIIYI